jgi:hypothetical protein
MCGLQQWCCILLDSVLIKVFIGCEHISLSKYCQITKVLLRFLLFTCHWLVHL